MLKNTEHLTDEQLDLENARSDQPPPSFDLRSVLALLDFLFPVGDDTDLGKSASHAPPLLLAGEDPGPNEENWWTDNGGGRSLLYPISEKHILATTPESQRSALGVVATESSLAAPCAAFVPTDMKGTGSQLSDPEALTLCAEILKRPLSNSTAGKDEKAKRINRILGSEED